MKGFKIWGDSRIEESTIADGTPPTGVYVFLGERGNTFGWELTVPDMPRTASLDDKTIRRIVENAVRMPGPMQKEIDRVAQGGVLKAEIRFKYNPHKHDLPSPQSEKFMGDSVLRTEAYFVLVGADFRRYEFHRNSYTLNLSHQRVPRNNRN